MSTRLSTRNKVNRPRKDPDYATESQSDSRVGSSPSSPEYYSSSTLSQSSTSAAAALPVERPVCSVVSHGSLIVVPPHINAFILENLNNPALLRSCLGDYYWNVLCL